MAYFKKIKIEVPGVTPEGFEIQLFGLKDGKLTETVKKGVKRFYSLEVLYDGFDGAFLHMADLSTLMWMYNKMKKEDEAGVGKRHYGYRFYSHEITARIDKDTGCFNAVDVVTVGNVGRRSNGHMEFRRGITTKTIY